MSRKKYRPIVSGFSETTRDREVLQEIDNFMRALSSYPDRVAHEPNLSFEQYLFRMNAGEAACSDGEVVRQAG